MSTTSSTFIFYQDPRANPVHDMNNDALQPRQAQGNEQDQGQDENSSSDDEGATGSTPNPRPSRRTPYAKVTEKQLQSLIANYVDMHLSISEAARRANVPKSTAYRYITMYQNNPQLSLSELRERAATKPKLREKQLRQEHTKFILALIDKDATLTVEGVHAALTRRFPGFSMSKSKIYTHMRTECRLALQRIPKVQRNRNSQAVLDERHDWVVALAGREEHFRDRCIFIGEAEFNTHSIRRVPWAREDQRAAAEMPPARGRNFTVIGAIGATLGVIDISVVLPVAASGSREKESETGAEEALVVRGEVEKKDTAAQHLEDFVVRLMDKLDENNMKGHMIVVDNAPIHKTLHDLVQSRGYQLLPLPRHSPFLNPMEECWSKVKSNFGSRTMGNNESLEDRFRESLKTVTTDNIHGWIRHSLSFFPRCIAKEQNL